MSSLRSFNLEHFLFEKKVRKILLAVIILIFLAFLIIYYMLGIVYNNGSFSVSLDKNLYFEDGLIIYDDPTYKVYRSELLAVSPDTFDNVSYKWLPADVDKQGGGTHNGENYLAYTFYIENTGSDVSDYWNEVIITDVIKNVDEAVRVRIYKNGEYVTYAKMGATGNPEEGTVAFQNEKTIVLEHTENFKPGEIHEYTLVLWVEGADPECTDNILGGEFKVEMQFYSEHVEEK